MQPQYGMLPSFPDSLWMDSSATEKNICTRPLSLELLGAYYSYAALVIVEICFVRMWALGGIQCLLQSAPFRGRASKVMAFALDLIPPDST